MKEESDYSLFPNWRELLRPLVVASQTVDPALNKDQPELGVLILPVPLQMLPDRNRLLYQVIQILRDLRSKTYKQHNTKSKIHKKLKEKETGEYANRNTVSLQNAKDLAAGDAPDLSNSMGVTENDADLRRRQTLLCELADVIFDLRGFQGLKPDK